MHNVCFQYSRFVLVIGIGLAPLAALHAENTNSPLVRQAKIRDAAYDTTSAIEASADLSADEVFHEGLKGQEGCCPACAGDFDECDCAKRNQLEKQAASAYKPLFYDNNFDYLWDPCYDGWHLGERLKQIPLGDCWTVDLGGEYRLRYQSEHNMRGKPLSGRNDDFLLHRTRLYANAEYGDRFRFYGEAIDATSNGQRFTPRGIEVNRFDALNLFGDLKLWENGDGELWGRVGRQELLYGAQRLVSPLDWSNTRRTFDGAKLFYRGPDWNVDGWWTRPVRFGQHIAGGRQDHNFDHPSEEEDFVGLWGSYKTDPGRALDVFFLRLDDYSGTLTNANANIGDADFNLFAARYLDKYNDWLYEVEGGYQFGEFGPDTVSAGFFTLGIGRKFECLCRKPTVWLYYDWASGDQDPTDSTHGTFAQYFPLGHKYFGFMDIIGRKNIEDLNVLATIPIHEKVKFLMWYHRFWLQSDTDALYNAAGAPIYQDPSGSSGDDVGQELDLLLVWTITARANLWFGYSHFWVGSYFDSPVIQSPGVPPGGIATNGANGQDADFFYTQFTLRF